MALPEQVKHHIVFEPPSVIGAEAVESLPGVFVGFSKEIFCRFPEQRKLVTSDALVINGRNVACKTGECTRIDPAVFCQPFKADQKRIAGESRSRRVGRVPFRGWIQRKHLPKSLARFREEVKEFIGGGAEVANSSPRWQRNWMEKNSSRAGKSHAVGELPAGRPRPDGLFELSVY